MKAVITVVGADRVGIIAHVSNKCLEYNVNILDITQHVVDEYFTMTMVADIEKASVPFTELVDAMANLGKELGLVIHTMHEDIFNFMHKI